MLWGHRECRRRRGVPCIDTLRTEATTDSPSIGCEHLLPKKHATNAARLLRRTVAKRHAKSARAQLAPRSRQEPAHPATGLESHTRRSIARKRNVPKCGSSAIDRAASDST